MKYKEALCQDLEEHMGKGLSFASFAGTISVNRTTLHRWVNKYPEFKSAYERGQAKCQLFWEVIGLKGCLGKTSGFNTGTWIFNMKNRFGWCDKVEQDIKAAVNITIDQDDNEL